MEANNDEDNKGENKLKQKEDKINNVKVIEDATRNRNYSADDNTDDLLKHVMRKKSKRNQNRKYMMYDNKKGEISLVKIGGEFPMFRLPRERAQYRESEVE